MSDTENDATVWNALLASGKSPAPDSPLVYGFWRNVHKVAGYATPVSTWSEDAFWLVSIAGADPIDRDCGEEWTGFLAKTWPRLQAVEYADYVTALDTGAWPNGMRATKDRLGIGGNNPPEDLEPHEAIAREITALEQKVGAWLEDIGGKPSTKAQADIVAQHYLDFQGLEGKAKKARTAETGPLYDAWQAALEKWKPIVAKANTLKTAYEDMGQAYVLAENARLAEEARKERERLAAIEAEKAAEAAAAGEPAPEPAPPPPFEPEPPKVTIGTGRQMGAHKLPPQVEVGNDAAFAAFLAAEGDPDLKACLLKVARAKVKANVAHLPGVLVDGKPRLSPKP